MTDYEFFKSIIEGLPAECGERLSAVFREKHLGLDYCFIALGSVDNDIGATLNFGHGGTLEDIEIYDCAEYESDWAVGGGEPVSGAYDGVLERVIAASENADNHPYYGIDYSDDSIIISCGSRLDFLFDGHGYLDDIRLYE